MTYPFPNDPSLPPQPASPPETLPPTVPAQYPQQPQYPAQYPPQYPIQYPANVPQPWAQATPMLSYQFTDRVEKGVSQLPLLSMIAGIVSLPFLCSSPISDGWPLLSTAIAVAAVVLGHVSLARIPRTGVSRGNGMAITGLIFGYLMIAIAVVWVLLRLRYTGQTS